MATIEELKELPTPETPLFLFECVLPSGSTYRWSTHGVSFGGYEYSARILRHNLFEMRSSSDDGTDGISRLSILLGNVDSFYSPVERNGGWKGAKVTASLVFFNLQDGSAVSDRQVLFKGMANPPEESTEAYLKLSFTNRLSLQRVVLPDVRIQKRCPWSFPTTDAQRTEAQGSGPKGPFSPFFKCGYSAGTPGGVGNLDGNQPFSTCDFSRGQCGERGMFSEDANGNITARFGGIEFVPPATLVRGFGDRSLHLSPVLDNQARYNDFVPLIYGTGWCTPPVVFARNDGNLTRMEVVLSSGEIAGVVKIIVNDVEIPEAVAGSNMTATGWYNLVSPGTRNGSFNLDFTDATGKPVGDPYGSMAYLSVVVPNRISDGRSLPTIVALVQGLKVDRFSPTGALVDKAFSNNPAWVLLDVLRRSGWDLSEIDTPSFGRIAARCDELVVSMDTNGGSTLIPRFQCNLQVVTRKSAADVVRGIRMAAAMYLVFTREGLLELRCEDTLAIQQPSLPQGSNSTSQIRGGWPAYEFGDGRISGIIRRDNGQAAFRVWCRSMADSPNRYNLEFQDEFNEYQQDGLSLVDADDSVRVSQELSANVPALGVPNFDQATRVTALLLSKSVLGNTYVDFDTSVRAVGLRPGDIIALSYTREGWERQLFRVVRIAPGANYRTASITAQIHDDAWYQVSASRTAFDAKQPGYGVGVPRPLVGAALDADGAGQFVIDEKLIESTDGSATVQLAVGFGVPTSVMSSSLGIPLVGLDAESSPSGGQLAGGQTLYYGVTALDQSGAEGGLSFLVRVSIPSGSSTNSVFLPRLSFPLTASAFNVYRGLTSVSLFQIAAGLPIASSFTDAGGPVVLKGPPDPNYDHANFYWRLELQPEQPVDLFSAITIGSTALGMSPNEFRGGVVRITRGAGASQERECVGNTTTVLTVTPAWTVLPDPSSSFVVSESSWRYGATSQNSPITFDVPNREGSVVHVSGRAANARNFESAADVSPLTRHQIVGGGVQAVDSGVPPSPSFGISLVGSGAIELQGISFPSPLTNVRTIVAGTLTLIYWSELSGSTALLGSDVDATVDLLSFTSPLGLASGTFFQIDQEIFVVNTQASNSVLVNVGRGVSGSSSAPHAANSTVYILEKKLFILPFAREFFGSPSSGSFAFPVYIPDIRLAAAEMFMSNSRGDGYPTRVSYTGTRDSGLRTLSGGQLSIQVEGMLAIESNVAPPLTVDSTKSLRDIYATLGSPSTGTPVELEITRNGQHFCALTIPTGSKVSNVVDGFALGVLSEGDLVGLNIISVSQDAGESPGRDLTVAIRL